MANTIATAVPTEEFIREGVKYNLDRLIKEETEKYITAVVLELDTRLRKRAAETALTLVKESSVEMRKGKMIIELHLPEEK